MPHLYDNKVYFTLSWNNTFEYLNIGGWYVTIPIVSKYQLIRLGVTSSSIQRTADNFKNDYDSDNLNMCIVAEILKCIENKKFSGKFDFSEWVNNY